MSRLTYNDNNILAVIIYYVVTLFLGVLDLCVFTFFLSVANL